FPLSASSFPPLRVSPRVPLSARKCEGDVDATRGRSRLAASAADDHILVTVCLVHRRRSIAGKWKRSLPQELSRSLVIGSEFLVEVRRPDKQQASRCHDASAVVLAPRVLHSLCGQRRILSKRNLPNDLSPTKVYRIERTPGRRNRRVALRV